MGGSSGRKNRPKSSQAVSVAVTSSGDPENSRFAWAAAGLVLTDICSSGQFRPFHSVILYKLVLCGLSRSTAGLELVLGGGGGKTSLRSVYVHYHNKNFLLVVCITNVLVHEILLGFLPVVLPLLPSPLPMSHEHLSSIYTRSSAMRPCLLASLRALSLAVPMPATPPSWLSPSQGFFESPSMLPARK